MVRIHPRLLPLALSLLFFSALAQTSSETSESPPLTAEEIMARVAVNQDRAEAERNHYLYEQHARIVSRKGKTIMCEEITDSRVTPSSTGSHSELLKLDGRLLRKSQYVTYTTPRDKKNKPAKDPDELHDDDIDRDLVENMRSDLTNDKTKDGIASRLFPLTSKDQSRYSFHLAGHDRKNGHDVFHITFQPKDKNDYAWKGDAYIDVVAFQPVAVSTALSRKIPFAVRTLLGTNLPGLGFTVVYAPQQDGIWFPVSFGTEFKLHVLFLFSREVIIDAQNRSFEKTHVSSQIVEVGEVTKPE
jgi:hypothetical protein